MDTFLQFFTDHCKSYLTLNLHIGISSTFQPEKFYFKSHFSNNAIFGALAILITVAFAFGYLYAAIYMEHPHVIDASYAITMDNVIEATIYFSFETITTLGFGDIYPVDPRVGAIAVSEALFGTAYLAIVISKFVSLSMAGQDSKKS